MEASLKKFRQGQRYVRILETVGDSGLYQKDVGDVSYEDLDSIKFIPASGAASRMFKDLYGFLEDREESPAVRAFFQGLKDFPFYPELKASVGLEGREGKEEDLTLEEKIALVGDLLSGQLSYGQMPKALIPIHRYPEGPVTPIDEHLREGEGYLGARPYRYHFTVSPDHQEALEDYVKELDKPKGEVSITYSHQKPATDTLAVSPDNQPFLLEDGSPLYRPGGHGALIENLNDLEADLVFIKNIDNVCHKDHLETTVREKRKLAQIGVQVRRVVDGHLKDLEEGKEDLEKIRTFLEEVLHIHSKKELTRKRARAFLDRPLRVCGLVKNQGEPGGGPFIVDAGDYSAPQICEMSEIDLSQEKNQAILKEAAYFNPVDLVCFLKDHRGKKYDLRDYVNPDRYFISEKSYQGRKLKALELPGLWNGAMDQWNTVFAAVPLETFNPVKTVNDLLRWGHQPKKD